MEELFMQFFERGDWVEAQVQQQADSYAQTIACSLLAAGHRPPDWLLPSYVTEPQELNGKPIVPGLVFTGSQITTPATNRTVFLPPAVPSTFFRKSGVPNGYTHPDANWAALDTDQHEEPLQEQTSLNNELSETLVAAKMSSRIQRSRSRKRNMEDRLRGRDEAAKSGSHDDIQDGTHRSKLANVGSNRTNASSSSVPYGDVANNAKTTSSRPGQGNGLCASLGRSTDSKCHNNLENEEQLDSFPSLIVENKIVCSDSNAEATNNCSVRDLLVVPLPCLSKLKDADSLCHIMPETHLLVEPKKLQFDGVESVCINPASEQTGQQQESGLECDHIDLSARNPLSEEPSLTSSQGPHSMDRPLLDGVKSGHLNPDSAPVKQHHRDALECGHPDLTGTHSQNKEPFLTCSSETLNAMGDPLLQKDTRHIPETNSLGRACSKVSQPLEVNTSNSDETNCSERPRSVGNPLLGNDTVQSVEDNEILQSSNSHDSAPHCGSLQLPTQLADTRFGAQASSGILPNSLLGEHGCDHLSNLLINGTNSQCSQGRSAVSLEQLPPQTITPTDVCQSSLSSYRTQSNDKHSNGRAAVNTFDNELSQDQYLLARPSLEFNGCIPDVDTPLGHPPLGMQSETLKGNPVSYSVNCHSEKLGDDAQLNKSNGDSAANRKNDSAVPKVVSSISSGRTREMHGTERNSVALSEKSNGSLQQGTEQVTPHVENAVQTNANSCTAENVKQIMSARRSESCEKNNKLQAGTGNALKRSVADGVQINGGTSSKRKRIKCQDIAHLSSSNTNSLSPDHQDGISNHVVTAENFSGKSQPSGRYRLRSSGFHEFMSLKSETRKGAANCKMSVASDVQENEDSSPKLRNRDNLSDVALCTSSAQALSPNFNCGISSTDATEGMDFQDYQAQLQNIFDIATTSAVPSCSNITPDNVEHCTQEEHPCIEGEGLTVTNSSAEHQQMALQMDKMSSQSVIFNPENYSSTDPTNIFLSNALDQHGIRASSPIALVHEKLSYRSGVELDMKCKSKDLTGCLLSDATIPKQKNDESVDCSDTMPQFESFDFSVPFDSPTTEKRAFETLRDSGQFSTLSSDISKYKMNTASGMRQLLASMSGKSMNCSFHDDVRQCSASNDGSIADIFGSCGLGHNGSFFTSDVIASCSSDGSNNQENCENPLTPAVEKYSLGKHSARVGSVSEHMGSIPELSCFRIDKDSGIEEENDYQDLVAGSVGNQKQSGRKALQDITGLCQNTGTSASYSIGTMDTIETCSSELNHHSDLRNYSDNKKPKGNGVTLVKIEGKVSHFPHNRLSKTEAIDNKNQRHMSEANLGKQSKPSNMVANVASFIPLVRPKVNPTTSCVKKDIRVKALEAAEAAKRLEEKKRNEREMRKAAAKLEREKLKQEKELKQKQEEEQKKKRDADVANRKRQRDEDERREKERKRKCAEEARKQQKQPMERRHPNDEKDAHPKAPVNKGLQKNLVEAMKSQVKSDETTGPGYKAIKSNYEKVEVVDGRSAHFGSVAKENIRNSFEESYMMTPYKDSDEEDDDDFDHKEELRRRRKITPSWVREENLVEILLDNRNLDGKEIFARKCSFNLSDVLPVHVPQRGFR
uniref:Inner centromere protein ARK-binding domain-containing protein n=1 Tax=Arundo donax TaxID=35708 RepID=A0A0A9DDZ4_ARUDO